VEIAMHLVLAFVTVASLLLGPFDETPAQPTRDTSALVRNMLVEEGIVAAPVADVWSVFSTGEGFKKLGPAQAEIDLRVGGRMRTHYDPKGRLGDEGTIENEILAFEPQRSIAFRIHQPPKAFPFPGAWKSTWTVVTLDDLGGARTHVRIAMLGYDDTAESQAMRAFFATGNAWTLQKLQSTCGAAVAPAPADAHASAPLAPVVLETIVSAAREDVWRALTTAEGWRSFFGAEATIGSMPGDPFEILFDPKAPSGARGSEGCTLLSSIPGEMVSFTWNAPPQFARARAERTWVVVDLAALSGTTTRVRLRHVGFDAQAGAHPAAAREWEEVRAYFAAAWPKVLGALAGHFATPVAAAAK
jgi:uncharacterized protein YndB with AHSA1/START domain